MHDTWFSRDVPVLEAVVRRRDANPHELTDYHDLAGETGPPEEDVVQALAAWTASTSRPRIPPCTRRST